MAKSCGCYTTCCAAFRVCAEVAPHSEWCGETTGLSGGSGRGSTGGPDAIRRSMLAINSDGHAWLSTATAGSASTRVRARLGIRTISSFAATELTAEVDRQSSPRKLHAGVHHDRSRPPDVTTIIICAVGAGPGMRSHPTVGAEGWEATERCVQVVYAPWGML